MRSEKRTFVDKMSFPLLMFLLVLLGGCTMVAGLMTGNGFRSHGDEQPMVNVLPSLDYGTPLFLTQWDSINFNLPDPSQYHHRYTVADSIIDYAMRFLRVPYVPAGKGPNKFDCSGFTSYIFRRFGYELDATAVGQLRNGWMVIDDPADLRRGDLVFYGGRKKTSTIGHVAIVVDNDWVHNRFTFIHATVKLGVTVSTSTETYYAKRYITACRILPDS